MIRARPWPKQQEWPDFNITHDVMVMEDEDSRGIEKWEYLFLFDDELEAKERERAAAKQPKPTTELQRKQKPMNDRQREQLMHRLEQERKMNLKFQELQQENKL
jgi:hypothetical protein